MVVGQTNILFPILVNQSTGGQFNTENRFNLQDAFVTSELGVFLYTPSSATATNIALLSYPNPTQFAAGSAAAAETIYHSYLTLSVNKQVLVPFWDVCRCRLTNQTQETATQSRRVGSRSALRTRRCFLSNRAKLGIDRIPFKYFAARYAERFRGRSSFCENCYLCRGCLLRIVLLYSNRQFSIRYAKGEVACYPFSFRPSPLLFFRQTKYLKNVSTIRGYKKI